MRRSRHLAAAAFLLLFIFGVQNVSTRNVPVKRGAPPPKHRCYDFYGKVQCRNKNWVILPNGKVNLLLYDFDYSFDLITWEKIKFNFYKVGEKLYDYKISACYYDQPPRTVQFALQLDDVCWTGQRVLDLNPKFNVPASYVYGFDHNNGNSEGVLRDGYYTGEGSSMFPKGHPRTEFNVDGSLKNQSMSHQYYHRRQPNPSRLQSDLQPLKDTAGGQAGSIRHDNKPIAYPQRNYRFNGQIHCRIGPHSYDTSFLQHPIVNLWESDINDRHLVASASIERSGRFSVWGNDISDGGKYPYVELYLEFVNVCSPGVSHKFYHPEAKYFYNFWLGANGQIDSVTAT